jgi:5-methylcytosine-specific restriction endonuclease McrBC regulatory subunit McrC
LDAFACRDHFELHEQVREFNVASRLIDHNSHGALARMSADINQRASKSLVVHGGHRNQHLAIEIAARGSRIG